MEFLLLFLAIAAVIGLGDLIRSRCPKCRRWVALSPPEGSNSV